MNQFQIANPKSRIFLGVDGGQSHTEAVVADANGFVLGHGFGGASNHAEVVGGRERLQQAITKSVGEALAKAGLPPIEEMVFASAHFGMTGGADYKEKIIGEIVEAGHLIVGHDAPTALFGATAGEPGIVVIAGTGSVVYGENEAGETIKIGGLGYLFSDEGSGFWLAAQAVRLAIQEQDGLLPPIGFQKLVLNFFGYETIRELTTDFYNAKISRDELASLAKAIHQAAADGNEMAARQINYGAMTLSVNVKVAARRLGLVEDFAVAGVGGMFRGHLMEKYFCESLQKEVVGANFTKPRFNPAIGALLLAFRHAGIETNEDLLLKLDDANIK